MFVVPLRPIDAAALVSLGQPSGLTSTQRKALKTKRISRFSRLRSLVPNGQ